MGKAPVQIPQQYGTNKMSDILKSSFTFMYLQTHFKGDIYFHSLSYALWYTVLLFEIEK